MMIYNKRIQWAVYHLAWSIKFGYWVMMHIMQVSSGRHKGGYAFQFSCWVVESVHRALILVWAECHPRSWPILPYKSLWIVQWCNHWGQCSGTGKHPEAAGGLCTSHNCQIATWISSWISVHIYSINSEVCILGFISNSDVEQCALVPEELPGLQADIAVLTIHSLL